MGHPGAGVTVTWYQHAVAYAEMKWPHLAAHSRASMADALATVTPVLARETGRRPSARELRAALYGHAFNPQQRLSAPGPVTASALAWLGCAYGWTVHPRRPIRSPTSGRCSTAPSATRSSSGYFPPTRPTGCSGARPPPPLSVHPPSPARRRSGRSWPRSVAAGRIWSRSSAACTTRAASLGVQNGYSVRPCETCRSEWGKFIADDGQGVAHVAGPRWAGL